MNSIWNRQRKSLGKFDVTFEIHVAPRCVYRNLCIDKKVMVFNLRIAAQSNLPKV